MARILRDALLVLVLLVSSARADEPPCTKVEASHAGKPAPCTGIIYPTGLAQELAACKAADLPACRARLDAETAARNADRDYYESVLRSEQKASEFCCVDALKVLKKPCPTPGFFSRPEVAWPLGIVAGVVLSVVTVVVLQETGAIK